MNFARNNFKPAVRINTGDSPSLAGAKKMLNGRINSLNMGIAEDALDDVKLRKTPSSINNLINKFGVPKEKRVPSNAKSLIPAVGADGINTLMAKNDANAILVNFNKNRRAAALNGRSLPATPQSVLSVLKKFKR